jgi:uncharacterized protein (DUF342 family)
LVQRRKLMKEKNKKGLLSFFQNLKKPCKPPENDIDLSSGSEENNAEKQSGLTSPSVTEEALAVEISPAADNIICSASIWEPSKDPLIVMVNEDILNIECQQFLAESKIMSDEYKNKAEIVLEEEESVPEAMDAKVRLYISKDNMAAWVYVIPPFNNGQEIKKADIEDILSKNHVTTGVLEDAIETLISEQDYDHVVLVARGVLARNGIDGTVNDYFERVFHLEFHEDERGAVDYKQLNNIQSVKEGDVICEITHAVSGTNGMTVTGKVYPCENKGVETSVPAGRNTVLNDEGTLLTSQKTGHVTFINGKFHAEAILKVEGNVDNDTGNLDYDGDIFISGDVRNGFSVKASGSIDIRGSVEGAEITAGGPISIAHGMTGNQRGTLTSDDYIRCRYLEHCIVTAKGNIYAESIINSKVESNQDIIVTSGIGTVIGGTLIASNNIQAHLIGSKVRRIKTELIIGSAPQNVDEAERLGRELKQLLHNVSELKKNSTYLENSHKDHKAGLIQQLKETLEFLENRETEINNRLKELVSESDQPSGLIECRQLQPIARIKIGEATLLVNEEHLGSRIYRNSKGEIIIGSI